MAIEAIQSAFRDVYGSGWRLPPTPANAPAADTRPGRLSDAAAGAPALGGQEPPPDQPSPHRVQPGSEPQEAGERNPGSGDDGQPPSLDERDLDNQEKSALAQLKATDAKVRAHEQAHIAAGGPYVGGGASFTYQTGPDGRQYAVGGEVPVDASPVAGDPEATISKAQMIRAAALAPADPSAQDRQVAAQASQMETQARMEKVQEELSRSKTQAGDRAGESGNLTLGRAPEEPPPLSARLRSFSIYV
jgi:hypothetical protein